MDTVSLGSGAVTAPMEMGEQRQWQDVDVISF